MKKIVFWDIDTQKDFLNRDGALYVPDAELIKPNLKLLSDYARQKNIPVLGSVDRHFGTEAYKGREGELAKWGGPFPFHCMIGTEGELKIKETGLREVCTVQDVASERFKDWSHEPCNIYIENPVEQIPFDEYHIISIGKLSFHAENLWQKNNYGSLFQTFFEKQSYDVFTNPYVGEFLARTGIKESVVYGVATDYCVKAAVLGMQQRGIQCHVVEDAIKPVTAKGGLAALAEMYAAGAKPSTTKQILRGEYQ